MQARGATLAPGILFDSDMGRNIDAVLALSMLYGLGRGRVIGVAVNSSSLDAAAFCEVLARFYGSGGGLPVGLPEDGPKLGDSAMLSVPLAMRDSAGQPVFRTTIRSAIDTADPPVLFRNALLTQQEKQAIAVLAGPATNLAHLLALNGGRDIVAAKVQLLVMAAGAFDGTQDPRIQADTASARKVLAEWPSPIVVVGTEAAKAVPYPDQTIESDLSTVPNHPVVAAYRAFRGDKQSAGTSGVPVQGVLAALLASNSNAEYLKLSRPGQIEVTGDGRTTFKESPAGTHRHLVIDPAEKERIADAFIKMSAVRPAAGGRGARN